LARLLETESVGLRLVGAARMANVEDAWNNILMSVTVKAIAVEILALRSFVIEFAPFLEHQ
jgi:hypothetical protein